MYQMYTAEHSLDDRNKPVVCCVTMLLLLTKHGQIYHPKGSTLWHFAGISTTDDHSLNLAFCVGNSHHSVPHSPSLTWHVHCLMSNFPNTDPAQPGCCKLPFRLLTDRPGKGML